MSDIQARRCITPEKCLTSEKRSINLAFIPYKNRTLELCIKAVKQCKESFYDVPEEYITYEFCLEAVKHNGSILEYIAEEYKEYITYELCLAAIKDGSDHYILSYVPKKYKTYDLCLEALKNNICSINFVPKKYLSEDFILKVAFKSDDILSYFQRKLSTNLDFNLVKYLL
jgi:hypothetical protein